MPFTREPHAGGDVAGCMAVLQALLRPAGYLQVGGSVAALEAAGCPALAIWPDGGPGPVGLGGRPSLHLFRGDSRDVLARHDPRRLLGGPVGLALLDGLPLFERMLWDFVVVEQACGAGAAIALNNCLPLDLAMAGRDPEDQARRARSVRPDWWTGDAWKIAAILAVHRPELVLHCVDAAPAGLIVVTNLDPRSRVLAERFDAIVAAYRALADEGAAFAALGAGLRIGGIAALGGIGAAEAEVPERYRCVELTQLAPLDIGTLLAGGTEGRLAEPPDEVRRFFRAAPEFIDDPAGRGIIAPFGDDQICARAASIAWLGEFRLAGHRSILTPSGLLLHDEVAAEARDANRLAAKLAHVEDDFLNEQTGLAPAADGDGFTIDWRGREVVELEGPVVVLCTTEPSNYGSWIYRTLPKLQIVRQLALDGLPMLVHAPQPYHRAFLEALGIGFERVIQHDSTKIYHVRSGYVPSLRGELPFLDPGGRELYAWLRRRYGVRPEAARTRIYVSRRGWSAGGRSARVLLNEAELAHALAGAGFDIVEPETLSLAEQIRVFSAAELVVGPAGSALYNAVFCQPGTRIIDIESEPHWVPLHSCLFASLGCPYGIFVGAVDPDDERDVHKRWSVDVPALLSRIENWQ